MGTDQSLDVEDAIAEASSLAAQAIVTNSEILDLFQHILTFGAAAVGRCTPTELAILRDMVNSIVDTIDIKDEGLVRGAFVAAFLMGQALAQEGTVIQLG